MQMPFRPRYTGLIDKYRDRLPVHDDTRIISLGEGNTPLIRLNNIPREVGHDVDIYIKYEGLNPTGSFKDRGMTMAVTKAVEEGSRAIICASTGNTSAAAAAYAARAGISDDGPEPAKQIGKQAPLTIATPINPYRLQGQKTAAFETVEELECAPDYHCLPVGNAGNLSANWMGYAEYKEDGIINSTPKMIGYQASGAATFLRGGPVENPETVATAIRIGHPQSWDKAWLTQKESGGWFDECSDEEILAAQQLLARKEGIFCEPASATSLAGALRDIKRGKLAAGSKIDCTLTGHGLKDPDIAIQQSLAKIINTDEKLDAVKKALLDNMTPCGAPSLR